MKQNLIVTSSCDTQHLLNEFNITDKEYHYTYHNELNKNFDALLQIDSVISDTNLLNLCKINDIPIIGSERYPKSIQHLILKKLNVNTPDTYFSNTKSDYKYIELLKNIENNEKIIIKMENGAKGLGQMMCTKKEFVDFSLNGYFTEDKKDNIHTEESNIKFNDKNRVLESLQYHGVIFQKYINVLKEYRILYFYGEKPMIIERLKTDNNWQANSCITGYRKYIENIEDINLIENILEDTTKIANYINAPFLSLDLHTTENSYGFFEFQMEFGIVGLDHNTLITRLNNSIHNKLKSIKNGFIK